MASYANISADQGASFQTILELEDSLGDPIDVTDYNIYGEIRRTYKSLSSTSFIIIKLSSAGVIKIELDHTQTVAMKPGRYVYDIYAMNTEVSNSRIKLLEGIFELIPSVTKIIE
jgi:hypothetical protein